MKSDEAIALLKTLHVRILPHDDLEALLKTAKEEHVKKGDELTSKQFWIYQTIAEIHNMYVKAFMLLQKQEYYQGWCQLERIEIGLKSLKRHYDFSEGEFFLSHIERSVLNLQVIFPYRLFASSELLKKRKKCSVCDSEVSIRNPCGHIVGEIYQGEMCHRIVTEFEVLGISLVQNPGNKYSVMFLTDEETGKQVDQYNYDAVKYLFDLLHSPYEYWDLEVSQKEVTKNQFGKIGRNDQCVCHSGKKFKNCCYNHIGEKYPHYEFIVTNPSDKTLLTNTGKSINR